MNGHHPLGVLIENRRSSSRLRLALLDLVGERSRNLEGRKKVRGRSVSEERKEERKRRKTHSDVVVSFCKRKGEKSQRRDGWATRTNEGLTEMKLKVSDVQGVALPMLG